MFTGQLSLKKRHGLMFGVLFTHEQKEIQSLKKLMILQYVQ